MNRAEYLNITVIDRFVTWGSAYLSKWTKRHVVKKSVRSPDFVFDIQGIEAAYEQYYWKAAWTHPVNGNPVPSDNAESTTRALLELANGLAQSINEPAQHAAWCYAVLEWGGVPMSRNFYMQDVERTVRHHVRCHVNPGILIPEKANDIDCANHTPMSSGITKVHALS
ncbi:hypothetical protein [Methylocaldum sp. GT1BB]|jgi:hypothetical protein|uniref:hypothetical protein n=1 Tax=Methylocaldum sp. GT1BB TaxID=3438963 RepID=UPI003DA0CE58